MYSILNLILFIN